MYILAYFIIGFIIAFIGTRLVIKNNSDIPEEGIGGAFLYALFLWPVVIIITLVFYLCIGLGIILRKNFGK